MELGRGVTLSLFGYLALIVEPISYHLGWFGAVNSDAPDGVSSI
jgi:hypothetical protein